MSFLCHSSKQKSEPDNQNLVGDFRTINIQQKICFFKSRRFTKKLSLSSLKFGTSFYVIISSTKKI